MHACAPVKVWTYSSLEERHGRVGMSVDSVNVHECAPVKVWTYSSLEERHGRVRMSVDSGNVHERAPVPRPLVDRCLEFLHQKIYDTRKRKQIADKALTTETSCPRGR